MFGVMVMVRVNTTQNINPDPDLTFPRVIYWNHTSNVWCLTQGNVCNRLRAFANV